MLGIIYGVDFVAYRHHPALVHSENVVIVLSEKDGIANKRVRCGLIYCTALWRCREDITST